MKKVFITLSLIAICLVYTGCYEVSTVVRDTQVKTVNMNAPSYVKPLVAELLVKKGIDGESIVEHTKDILT